jgi:hypothetical protein
MPQQSTTRRYNLRGISPITHPGVKRVFVYILTMMGTAIKTRKQTYAALNADLLPFTKQENVKMYRRLFAGNDLSG